MPVGGLTSSISSVMAMANTPSLNASMRPVSLASLANWVSLTLIGSPPPSDITPVARPARPGLGGPGGARGCQAVVIQAEKLNHGGHVLVSFYVVGDPARIGENMVEGGTPRGHELAAHSHREGQVRLPVAMQVPHFVVVDPEFD